MTEQKWLTCTVPDVLLNWLEGRASDRKLRLFATGCCRNAWKWMAHPDARAAVEVSERFADGLATKKELAAAKKKALSACKQVARSMRSLTDPRKAATAVRQFGAIAAAGSACEADALGTAFRTRSVMVETRGRKANADELENAYQCGLLRELVGNPFRRIKLTAACVNRTVAELAASIYEQRRFDRMPVLGDVLEEAGCDSDDVLTHCRDGGEHVRGCWVLDLVLGKEAKLEKRR